jgi:FtsZ-interacting cell division protein ZipA
MSDLQVALVILGLFIIAGVVVYNWMQERKLRREVSSDFIVPQKDVLAQDFDVNVDAYVVDKELAEVRDKARRYLDSNSAEAFKDTISLANAITEPASQSKSSPTKLEPTIEIPKAELQKPETSKSETVQPQEIIKASLHEKLQDMQVNLPEATHPQIDLTAILFATKNIGHTDLESLSASLNDITVPVLLHGLTADDKWLEIATAPTTASYKQIACSMQLADRGGPVAKSVLNKFQFAVEDTGLNLNTHVEWQGNGDPLQRAIELDQFCIEVDQMVSVHIAGGETPIHGTKFKGLAEASGMLLKEDGKFHFYNNETPLYAVIDTNNVPFTSESLRNNVLKSITFQLEIPKVNNCEQVFNQMILNAQKIASSLNGHLVDDNQKLLGDLQIEKIRQQLRVIHATMVARGVMPGSPSSMRLFN